MSPSVVEQIRDELVAGAERYELRSRRVRAAGVAALLVVAIATGAFVWEAERTDGPRLLVQPDTTSTTTTQPAPPLAPGPLAGLAKLPAPPGDVVLPSSPVWTGHEFLFVGVTTDNGPVVAKSFDLDTRTWSDIPQPPSTIGQLAATVWTGKELIVCCGDAPTGSGAAAFDPDSNAWRVLPDPPVHGYATAVWTGTAMIVVTSDGTASFDRERDAWTRLPAPPESANFARSVWTGHQLVLWPAPGSRTVHQGEAYNPVTKTWSTLPAPPERSWPAIPDIAWLEGSLVVLGGLPANTVGSERLVGARYEPSTDAWTSLPEPLPEPLGSEGNLGSQHMLWTGRYLLMFAGDLASGVSPFGALMAYDPKSNAWRFVGDTNQTALRPVVMAGDRVLLERDGNYYLSVPDWNPPPQR